jgi:hypothetical protein
MMGCVKQSRKASPPVAARNWAFEARIIMARSWMFIQFPAIALIASISSSASFFGETKRLTVDDKLHPFVVVLMLADTHQVPVTIQGQLGCASNHVYSPQKGISSSQQLHPAC